MALDDAFIVLRRAAKATRVDVRRPKAAVTSLWCNLHAGDPETTGVVFRALAAAAGTEDVSGVLGNTLRRMTPDERADLCELAAETV